MLQKKTLKLALASFLMSTVMVSFCNAQEGEPLDLVKKGVKFMGGEKNLKKYKAITFDEKGVYYGTGQAMPYEGKYSMDGFNKFKMEIVGVFTTAFDGKNGWKQEGGQTIDMSDDEVDGMKVNQYASMVMWLYPLTDKKFKLSFDGEETVSGKKTRIVKVSSKGHDDVRLFLDAKTGAVMKWAYKGPMDGAPKTMVKYEVYHLEYKSGDKIKYVKKYRMTRDGEKFLEATASNFKTAEKLPAKTFSKPE